MVMGKMKVKMKVKDEHEKDLFNPRFDLVVTVQNAPHSHLLMLAMPRPACRQDRYRGKAITQTSLQLARYRGNGTATAANTTATVQWHRYRENDTATAAIAPPLALLACRCACKLWRPLYGGLCLT